MNDKVCSLGQSGSYSHIAALKYFGNQLDYLACQAIDDIFTNVEKGVCLYGIAPLENSTAGSIIETYDSLQKYKFYITGEIMLNINHNLLANKKIKIGEDYKTIKSVYAHSQTFYQCKNFLNKYPWIRKIEVEDNAAGAKYISDNISPNFAISSKLSSQLNDLRILKEKIEDSAENYTRFIVIGKKARKLGNKISLKFNLKHSPGSLVKALKPYEKFNLNLTKIESRPIFGKKWEYQFYLDFEFDNLAKAIGVIEEMKRLTIKLQILGIYQKGKTYET